MAKKVLIVYHTIGGNTEAAAKAVAEGVEAVAGVAAIVKKAEEADTNDLLSCDAFCVGSPDYFGYMAGMVKDFFDRTFYPTQGQVDDKPCGMFVTHGGGGKAAESVEKICKSFRFKAVGDTVLVRGNPDATAAEALKALGSSLAKAV